MRLTLRQLHIFLAVADAGSTSAAATAISLSQSATSAALNELESVLAARLFDRVGKRLMLNDNGRLLLPQARQLCDGAAGIERQFAGDGPGAPASLRIGASTTIGIYLLPAILVRARQLYGASLAQANDRQYGRRGRGRSAVQGRYRPDRRTLPRGRLAGGTLAG